MQQDSGAVQVSPKLIALTDMLRDRAERLDLLVGRLDGLRMRLTGMGMDPAQGDVEKPPPSGIVGGLEVMLSGVGMSLDRFDEVMNTLEGIS